MATERSAASSSPLQISSRLETSRAPHSDTAWPMACASTTLLRASRSPWSGKPCSQRIRARIIRATSGWSYWNRIMCERRAEST